MSYMGMAPITLCRCEYATAAESGGIWEAATATAAAAALLLLAAAAAACC